VRRLADNRPLRLDAHPVRDLRNAFRFELVNTVWDATKCVMCALRMGNHLRWLYQTEVRDTDAALNGIKQYRALVRFVAHSGMQFVVYCSVTLSWRAVCSHDR